MVRPRQDGVGARTATAFTDLINARLRTAAANTQTPLIDLGAAMEAVCAPPCSTLFFKDNHPNARGYTRVAEVMVEKLQDHPLLMAD